MRLRFDCLALVLSVGGGIAAGGLSAAEGASPIGERPSRSNLLANGGFEFAGRLSQPRLRRVPNEGVTFENADPLLPVRWTWAGGGRAELRLVSEAHSGQHAVRVIAPAGAWLHLNMSLIEVVPNATYEFGVWLRGSGKGAIAVYGNAFEGRQELAREALTGTSAWSESRRGLTIPGHIRTISVELTAWGECDLSWDDVFFSAELARPFDPDAVLQRKLSADENTIAFADFDQPGSYRLEGGARLTDDGGGRFGKGVQLDRKSSSSATVPLSLDRMPDEGTLEFWFAPDEVPEHIHCYCVLLAGDTDVLKLQADTSDTLRLSWRTSAGIYDPQHSLACGSWQSRDWFRPGQWQHVAAQWNRQAVRYYLNGTLVDYSTDRPLPFFQTPSAIRLGSQHSVYDWSGRIDEVRLSRVPRYGPFVPVGAKWSEFVVAAAAEEQPAAPARPVPPPNFVTARQALIGRIPAPPAESTALDATALKPLLHDDARFQLEPDQPAPGMTTALIGNEGRLLRDPDNDGGYWKLGEIRPGRYFVGVWYGSGKPGPSAAEPLRRSVCLPERSPAAAGDHLRSGASRAGSLFCRSPDGGSRRLAARRRNRCPARIDSPDAHCAADVVPARTRARSRLDTGELWRHVVQPRHRVGLEPGCQFRRRCARRIPPG